MFAKHSAREQGRRRIGGRGRARYSDGGSGDAGQRLVTRRQSSLWSHSRGGRRCIEPLFQHSHANKGKIKDRG